MFYKQFSISEKNFWFQKTLVQAQRAERLNHAVVETRLEIPVPRRFSY